MKTIRIGCGQGFWGDWLEAPVNLVQDGPLDYLVLDYLAEVTMSVLAKQKKRDPNSGYAKDFITQIERLAPTLISKKVRVLANAGGVNPRACAEALKAALTKSGYSLSIAVVEGDNILEQVAALRTKGEPLSHMESSAPIEPILPYLQSANVYLGADPLVEALKAGADIVITGRVADPSLVLAPCLYEFKWNNDDWNKKASGIVAGHIIECGAQCSGGNCSNDWSSIPDLSNIGYPIAEITEDGSFVITKHPGSGGRVDMSSIKEQLVYEIGDPKEYFTPDVIADFTTLSLSQDGENRVRVSGVTGKSAPQNLKVSISFSSGYSSSGTILYTWPEALEKAKVAGEIVKKRLISAGVNLERIRVEYIGHSAAHENIAHQDQAEEVLLRIAVHDNSSEKVERFTREMASLVLNGPPGATSYAETKRRVQEVFAYWPTLISRDHISTKVTIL